MDDELEPIEGPGPDLEPRAGSSPLPFQDLVAPTPVDPAPPAAARWLAFGSILLGGALGALIGFGVGDLMGQTSTWAAVGALAGGLTGAAGVGVVANLTLRAMSEWRAVVHPEAVGDPAAEGSRSGRTRRRTSRQWTRRPSA